MVLRRKHALLSVNSKHGSFLLQETAGDAADGPALQSTIKADMAIAESGYVGLWTAIRIHELCAFENWRRRELKTSKPVALQLTQMHITLGRGLVCLQRGGHEEMAIGQTG
jgi:hypothetical protein